MGTENIWLIGILGGMAFVANFLYAVGGTEGFGKYWRRFIGATILGLSPSLGAVLTGVFDWRYLSVIPCLIVGFSLPYGSETTISKIIKRTVFALGVCSACFVGLWITGFSVSGWIVFGLSVTTALTSVALGVLNPFNNAPLVQFLICQVLTLYVPFWPFVK